MTEFKVPVSEITSARAAARIGAELLQHNLNQSRFRDERIGVCSVFYRLRDAVTDSRNLDYNSEQKKLGAINRAQGKFNQLFKPENGVGYWMGPKMQRADQHRRINALLATAERL